MRRRAVRFLATPLLAGGALLLAGGACAADGGFSDFRLEGSLLPEDYDYEADADALVGSVSISGEEKFDDAFRIGIAGQSLMTRGAPVGFSAGGVIAYQRLQRDDGVEERYETLSATVRLGLGITVGDVFHVEVLPFAGAGPARAEIGGEDTDDFNLYWEYGVMAGAFLTLANDLQLGVHAGWVHGEWDFDIDEDDRFGDIVDDVEAELENEGFFYGISIGVRV